MFFKKKKEIPLEDRRMVFTIDWDQVKDVEDLKAIFKVIGPHHIESSLNELYDSGLMKYTNARHLLEILQRGET